jgi:hypothetical protein
LTNERSKSLRSYFTSLVVRAMTMILKEKEKSKFKRKKLLTKIHTHNTLKILHQRRINQKKRKNVVLSTIYTSKTTHSQMVAVPNGITSVP